MSWGKFIGIAFIICIVGFIVLLGYGELSLVDDIVPEKGISIDDWMSSYYEAGIFSLIVALAMGSAWFWTGTHYSGGVGISLRYYVFWAISFIGSFLLALIVIYPAQEGYVVADVLVCIVSPICYYAISLLDSANAVKYIPPLGEKFHD